ncbi:MAG: glycosyltransferase [Acidipropionibacterium acidipropionici]|nr:glycosyltransferase [Acidipropionibacterium acidipropionici]
MSTDPDTQLRLHDGEPLRVVISSYGSGGDSAPLITLARHMHGHGDRVRLLLERDGADRARGLGLDAEPLAGDLRSARRRAKGDPTLQPGFRNIAEWARQTRRAAEDADVVVGSGLGAQASQVAARATGRPFVGVTMFPIVPTSAFGSPLALLPVPSALNRPTHALIQHLLWGAFGRALRPVYRGWGMSPLPLRFDDHPTLCAVSPALLAEPEDWPASARVVGDLAARVGHGSADTPGAPSDRLSPDLLSFLDAGPAPVYVGFGSMAVPDAGRIRDAVLGLSSDRRVIFSPGWSGIDMPSGPNLHVVGHAPHDALFPKMAVVVHHGGAGTLHAAARAGVPQVIVPMGGDQSWWAGRAHAAGIAAAPVRVRGLDAQGLRRAVIEALARTSRARDVAVEMASEDGCDAVDRAVHAAVCGG